MATGSWTVACKLIWGGALTCPGVPALLGGPPVPHPGAHSASMGEAPSALPQSQDTECVSPVGAGWGGPTSLPRFQNHHGQPKPLTALHSLRRAPSLRQHRKDAMAARINATVTSRPPRLGSQPGLADTEDATNPALNFRVPSPPHPEDFTRDWIKAALRGREQTARKRTEAHGQHF